MALGEVLGSGSYQERAAAIRAQLAGVDGAPKAADEIELLLQNRLKKAS